MGAMSRDLFEACKFRNLAQRYEIWPFSEFGDMAYYVSRFQLPQNGTKNLPTIYRQIRVLPSTTFVLTNQLK